MRINELWSEFKKGYDAVDKPFAGIGKRMSAAAKENPAPKSTPWSALSNSDAKKILAAILGGQQLEQYQLDLLKQVYNKL